MMGVGGVGTGGDRGRILGDGGMQEGTERGYSRVEGCRRVQREGTENRGIWKGEGGNRGRVQERAGSVGWVGEWAQEGTERV